MNELLVIDTTRPEDGEYNAELLASIRELDLHPVLLSHVDVPASNELIRSAGAVVVSGVPFNYPSETAEQLQPTLQPMFRELTDRNIPTLGVCLGHQALGLAFGATMRRNEEIEQGVVTITIPADEQANPLFNDLDAAFNVASSHWASLDITNAPQLVTLASSIEGPGTKTGCENEIIQVEGKPMYGVQFHPEKPSPDGNALLRNYFRIAHMLD